jgi:hypothetical protein
MNKGIAVMSPYKLLSDGPQRADRAILLALPTNAFSGLWSAMRRRDWLLAVVAFTSILSEFLPIVLAEIPFRVAQTWTTHLVCTWSSVAILCIMAIVIIWTFFVKWPHMPIDPSTIAGSIYYVCDSKMRSYFEGLSILDKRERDRRVMELGLEYRFGRLKGSSGITRIAVDVPQSRKSVV